MLIVPTGVGLTMTVAVIAGPGQPLAVGVIVKVTVTGTMPVLIRIPPYFPKEHNPTQGYLSAF